MPGEGSDVRKNTPAAAGPSVTLPTLTRLGSKLRSKLIPVISIPLSKPRFNDTVSDPPGKPEPLPVERLTEPCAAAIAG